MAQKPSSGQSEVSGKARVLSDKEKLEKNAVIDYTRAVLPILKRNTEEAHSELIKVYNAVASGQMGFHEFEEAMNRALNITSTLRHVARVVCDTADTALKHRDACLRRAALRSARKLIKRSCAWLRRGRSISSNRPPVRGLEPRTQPPT